MNYKHKDLAAGRWAELTFFEQLGNIGSEVGRVKVQRDAGVPDQSRFQNAFDRALELFDLTIADPRWKGRLKEILRARELFCYAALGEPLYGTTLEDLDRYFMQFALAARRNR